ncbi:MAG: hypothetical protein JJT95_08080 [Pararhodobacter sp.]|nr:hypothetical protein [Pararhodobacter sp.]
MPPKALFIITTARSGSNQMLNYINQVPGCSCYGEIFKEGFPDNRKGWKRLASYFPDEETARALHGSDVLTFWHRLVAAHEGAARVVGAKIFYHHRSKDSLWQQVYDPNSMVIHLWRDRVFDTYVSHLRAKHTGTWLQRKDAATATETGDEESEPALPFDRDAYLKYRRMVRNRFHRARKRLQGHPAVLSVEYDEIAAPAALSDRLGDFFGEKVSLRETLRKQARRAPISYLANPEEAEAFVQDRLSQREDRQAASR